MSNKLTRAQIRRAEALKNKLDSADKQLRAAEQHKQMLAQIQRGAPEEKLNPPQYQSPEDRSKPNDRASAKDGKLDGDEKSKDEGKKDKIVSAWKKFASTLVTFVLGGLTVAGIYWQTAPHFSIHTTDAFDSSYPLSTAFEIQNISPERLTEMGAEFKFYEVTGDDYSVNMGRSNSAMDIAGHPSFKGRIYMISKGITITTAPIVDSLASGETTTLIPTQQRWEPPAKRVDMDVTLKYKYLYVFPGSQTFRFVTRADPHGKISWIPLANNDPY